MQPQITIPLGKNGLTEGFTEVIKNAFKNHGDVKISLLKSSTRKREEAEEIAKKICKALGKHYTYNLLGFTIFLKKWRKVPYPKKKVRKF